MYYPLKAEQFYDIRGDFSPLSGDLVREGDTFAYAAAEYTVKTEISKHPSGVISRRDMFYNTSDRPLTLYTALSKFVFSNNDFEVYTQRCEWSEESVGAWQPLHTAVSVQNDDLRFACGAAPFMALYDIQRGSGYAFHLLSDALWQMKAQRHFAVDTHTADTVLEAGISERGFRYTVAPGESFALPEILFYPFESKLDMDAYRLHRYINDMYPARALPIIYNTWMYRFGNLDFDEMLVELDRASALGVEYFVLDAGWFGRGWNNHPGFGTWHELKDGALKGRMTELFDRVREKGLRPGVWFELEGASHESPTVKENADLYFSEKGRAFIDFANPKAVDHLFSIISDRITRYGIEFIKFDYNVVPEIDPRGASFYDYFKGYRAFISRLRAAHPDVYFECCAGGGLRMALCNVPYFDSFWMSDNHSLFEQLEIYKGTLVRMPARALEHWITVEGTEAFRENFAGETPPLLYTCGDATWSRAESIREDFLLRASRGGPIGFSCNLSAIPEESFKSMQKSVAEYKSEREFWKNSECRILADSDRALVLQFSDESLKEIKIYAFGKCKHQKSVTVTPVVLGDHSYEIAGGEVLSGDTLLLHGVTLPLDGEGSAAELSLSAKKE